MNPEVAYILIAFGLGLALASVGVVIPRWLNVRDEGYNEGERIGKGKGFKAGVLAERNRITQRSSSTPPLPGPWEYRSRED